MTASGDGHQASVRDDNRRGLDVILEEEDGEEVGDVQELPITETKFRELTNKEITSQWLIKVFMMQFHDVSYFN